jgi:hypothetical protein
MPLLLGQATVMSPDLLESSGLYAPRHAPPRTVLRRMASV